MDLVTNEALAFVELSRVSTGVVAADAAVKKAQVEILLSRPVSGPKFLLLFRGSVAPIGEAYREALRYGEGALIDSCFLPFADGGLWAFLDQTRYGEERTRGATDSVAIFETSHAASAILGADAALKSAPVSLCDFQMAAGLSGRSIFTFCGELGDVQAAADAAESAAGNHLEHFEVIASPSEDFLGRFFR